MNRKFHFISGLPRSGSTLLSAILRQNPAFHASVTSPVASMVTLLLPAMSAKNEFSVFFNKINRRNVLRGAVEGYYADNAAKVIFDTNRTWPQKLPVLAEVFPEAKIICCVRSLPEVLQSFERIYHSDPLYLSSIFAHDPNTTVYSRADLLMAPTGMIGASINGMKDAFYGANSSRLIFVPYQRLAAQPKETVEAIYEFIGEPKFKHDFANVEYDLPKYDERIGAPGLHRVRKEVKLGTSPLTLPPELVTRYSVQPFWVADSSRSQANTKLAVSETA